MEAKRLPLNLPPGLFQAGTKLQAEGRWYDGHLTRFFEKTVRSVGGWRRLVDVNSVVIPPVGGSGESGGSGSGATPRKVIAWAAGGATSARFIAVGAVGPVSEAEGGPGDGSDNKAHHLIVYREGIRYVITPDDLANAYVDSEGEWVEASGGDDVFDLDGFRYHVFLANGTFTITEPGRCEVLVVGGGGGAGATVDNEPGVPSRYAGGGGGGGEVVQVADIPFEAGAFPVIVGAGGAASGDGGTSSINDIEADGGEGGTDATPSAAGQGGLSGNGNLGGDIGELGFYGGGGGGAGGQGGTGDNAGFGGNGTSPTMYTVDALGRGGNGGRGDQLPGLANTGEGGDAVHNAAGAAGGSGIVVVRYRTN